MRNLIVTSAAMLLALPVASQALPDGTQFSNGPIVTAASGGSQTPSAAACSSYNMLATTTMAGGNTNVFATGSWVASPAQVVFGASVRTKAKSAAGGKVTCQIAIVDTAGMPTTVNAATCVINVTGTSFATYKGQFATPILLKPGTRYALVHSGDGQVDHPRNADANAVKVAHYWHPPSSTTWSGPWSSVSWAVQVDCTPGGGQPGKFSTYGTGCKGSAGGGSCDSYNMNAKTTMGGGNTNVFATGSWVASPGQVIMGASVRTSAKVAGGKITCQIATTDATGRPTAVNAATCVITCQPTFATYSGKFAAPIVLKPGTRYALVHAGDGNVNHPRNADANAVRVQHYWHPPTATAWNGPFSSVTWCVRVDCLGGGGRVPVISSTGEPKINTSFSVDLAKAAANAPCALIIGATRSKIDLTGLGAPGCILLATTDITLAAKVDATGAAVTKLTVPNNSWYVAKKLAFQWAVIDAKANRLGIALTSGGEATIGK